MNPRAQAVRASRPRGIYVPPDDVELHLACGWQLIDDCPDCGAVLMAPPQPCDQEAA